MHSHNNMGIYLIQGIFEALQGAAHCKILDRAEPVQQDDIVHKSPLLPVLFGHLRQLCFNLIHSDSEKVII